MSERRGYYTDLSDEQWALIGPVIEAWKTQHPSASGHSGRYAMREIVNAIVYQNRSGCQWSLLPADLPPASAVNYYFYLWRDDGLDQVIHDLLRAQVCERAGRTEDPSAVVLDTQSLHAANHLPAATTGMDVNKKVPGRKRGLAVDVLGLVIAVVVASAGLHENTFGTRLLNKVAAVGTVSKAWVDQGFKASVVEHGDALGIDVEIVKRRPDQQGLVVQAKRWEVEQTNGTLMLHRRLVRDYEISPVLAESRVLLGDNRRHGPTGDRADHSHPAPGVARGGPMPGTVLEKIAAREQDLHAAAEHLAARIADLTAEHGELQAELTDLATARKVVLALGIDGPPLTQHPQCFELGPRVVRHGPAHAPDRRTHRLAPAARRSESQINRRSGRW